jgi:putative tryptophan/tyrosine transport system substrate-binding protein
MRGQHRVACQKRAGVLVLPSVFIVTHRETIIALAAPHHLPAVYSYPFFAEAGGLMSYGVGTPRICIAARPIIPSSRAPSR